jgi:3-oxoacyl-[acyl-carrier-protein] synthase III
MAADVAAAAVLKKGETANRLLSYASVTDGSTVDCVKFPLGGTKFSFNL